MLPGEAGRHHLHAGRRSASPRCVGVRHLPAGSPEARHRDYHESVSDQPRQENVPRTVTIFKNKRRRELRQTRPGRSNHEPPRESVEGKSRAIRKPSAVRMGRPTPAPLFWQRSCGSIMLPTGRATGRAHGTPQCSRLLYRPEPAQKEHACFKRGKSKPRGL